MSYSVFLSHSVHDADWAKWVKQEAQRVGIDVYLFEHDPKPGTHVAAKIQEAIIHSDAVVVLLTPNSETAAYVQQEIGFAQAAKRLVIPLVWPKVKDKSLAMLQGKEYVPFDPRAAAQALPPVLAYLGELKTKKELGLAVVVLSALVLTAWGLSKN